MAEWGNGGTGTGWGDRTYAIIGRHSLLLARSPTAEDEQQIGQADVAAAVEVLRTVLARAPRREELEQVKHVDDKLISPIPSKKIKHEYKNIIRPKKKQIK